MPFGLVKKLFLLLLGSALALVLIALGAVFFLDLNAYKSQVSRIASNQTGLHVAFQGDMAASLFPRPGFSIDGLIVETREENARRVASADSVSLYLGLSALLGGNVEIARFELDGLKTRLTETKDGGWTVSGLETWEAQDTGEDKADEGSAALLLNALRLTDGEVEIVPKSGEIYVLSDIDIRMSGLLPYGPLEVDGGFSWQGIGVELDAETRPASGGAQQAVRAEIKAGGATLTASARFKSPSSDTTGRNLKGFTAQAKMSGTDLAELVSVLRPAEDAKLQESARNIPYLLDFELSEENGLIRARGRKIELGETRGKLDVTLNLPARQDIKPTVAATLALDVLNAEDLLELVAAGRTDQADTTAMEFPFTGDLDVTVNSFLYGKEIVRQMMASARFADSRLTIGQFSALMPGGTWVTLDGMMDMGAGFDYRGSGKVKTGNLPALLSAFDIDMPARVRKGRLIEGEIDLKHVSVTTGEWRVDLVGRMDTVNFDGTARGRFPKGEKDRMAGLPLSAVTLNVTDLNVDSLFDLAVLEEGTGASRQVPTAALDQQLGEIFTALDGNRFAFGGRLEKLRYQGQEYDVSLDGGRLSDTAIIVRSVTLDAAAAALAGRDISLEKKGKDWHVKAVLDDFKLAENAPFIKGKVPAELWSISRIKSDKKHRALKGMLAVSGPLSNVKFLTHLDFQDAQTPHVNYPADPELHRNNSLNLEGFVNLLGAEPELLSAGWRLESADVSPLLTAYEINHKGNAALVTTGKLGQTESGFAFDTKGRVQKLDFEAAGGFVSAGPVTVQGRFNHPDALDLMRFIAPDSEAAHTGGFAQNSAIDGEYELTASSEKVTVKQLDVRHGGQKVAFSGDYRTGEALALKGKLSVVGLRIEAPKPQKGVTARAQNQDTKGAELPRSWQQASVDMDLKVSDSEIYGQKLTLPSGRLSTVNPGRLVFAAGDNAALNGKPFVMTTTAALEGIPTWETQLQAGEIYFEPLMAAAGFSSITRTKGAVDMNLKGEGLTLAAVKKSMNGAMSLQASGGVLNFIEVATLARDIKSLTSGRLFLNLLGNRLRAGQTSFNTLTSQMTIAGGKLDLQQFLALGPWGQLNLGGDVDLLLETLNIAGELAMSSPAGSPPIPVTYTGSLSNPKSSFSSRLFESFIQGNIDWQNKANTVEEQAGQPKRAPNLGEALFGVLGGLVQKKKEKDAASKGGGGNE